MLRHYPATMLGARHRRVAKAWDARDFSSVKDTDAQRKRRIQCEDYARNYFALAPARLVDRIRWVRRVVIEKQHRTRCLPCL